MESIKHIIETKIASGTLKQRPKWHFTLIHTGIWVATLLAVLLLAYIIAFVLLVGKEKHFIDLVLLGPEGIGKVFQYIPYPLVGISMLLIVVLFGIAHQYAFVYRYSTLQTLGILGLAIISIAVGFALFDKEMNFARLGERKNIPIMKSMHARYRQPSNEITRGVIVGTEGDTLLVKDRNGTLYYAPRLTNGNEETIGSPIILFGPRQGDHIAPFGIRPDRDTRPMFEYMPVEQN
jgi:hypothetical protein